LRRQSRGRRTREFERKIRIEPALIRAYHAITENPN